MHFSKELRIKLLMLNSRNELMCRTHKEFCTALGDVLTQNINGKFIKMYFSRRTQTYR